MGTYLSDPRLLPFPTSWDRELDGGRLGYLEHIATYSWRLHLTPEDCDRKDIDRLISTNGAIIAWKSALAIRRDLGQSLEWRTRHDPYSSVRLLDSADELDLLVHEHAYGKTGLIVQCLLHQERLTGTIHPDVPDQCLYFPWTSAKQYVDLLIYLTNFKDLELAKALDFPQRCPSDTNLAHVCDLIARIVDSRQTSWESNAVWFLLAIFSEERYCRLKLRQEAQELEDGQRHALQRLNARQPWFKDYDADLVEVLVSDQENAN